MLKLVRKSSQNLIREKMRSLKRNQFIFPEKVYFEGFLSILQILSSSFDFRIHSIRLVDSQYNIFIDKPRIDFNQLVNLANLMYAEKYQQEQQSASLILRRGFKSFVTIEVSNY